MNNLIDILENEASLTKAQEEAKVSTADEVFALIFHCSIHDMCS